MDFGFNLIAFFAGISLCCIGTVLFKFFINRDSISLLEIVKKVFLIIEAIASVDYQISKAQKEKWKKQAEKDELSSMQTQMARSSTTVTSVSEITTGSKTTTVISKTTFDVVKPVSAGAETSQSDPAKGKASHTLGEYILRNNHCNLFATAILFLLILIFGLCPATSCCMCIAKSCCLGFVGFRVLSRTMEINISFFKDITVATHSSDLAYTQRISLAMLSLVEEALLFSSLYMLLRLSVTDSILGGLSSFALNVFSSDLRSNVIRFVAVYQVICSIILVSLSIAGYISDKNQTAA